jgi:hypothetical protein
MHPMTRASSYPMIAACLGLAAAAAAPTSAQSQGPAPAAPAAPAAKLDYDFFKDKVQQVFLTKRPGHARCVVCHTINSAPFHLVSLSPGATSWDEDQSRQNFELVQRVAAPGFMESPLIKHPLAQEAGGDAHHGGGQQFASQSDPDWLTLKAFVSGAQK